MTTTPTTLSAAAQSLIARIHGRKANVGVIGLGYVGLPLTLLFSEQKIKVTGFDIDPKKVATLNTGGSYIQRITPKEIAAARAAGFTATADYTQISKMDAVIICVPTPLNEFREPDMSYITGTADAIAPHLVAGQVVILESTTYPGTTDEVLVPILEKGNPKGLKCAQKDAAGDNTFFVAFSPEREDPGNDTVARHDIPKVVGGVESNATQIACALYGTIFGKTVPVSTPATAEMTKLLENIYRCVNIALVNELKQLALRMDIDIWEVIAAAATKPFGFHPFYPGPGLGGHCIPVDPFYLSWKAKEFDFQTRFIELAGEINTNMPYFVVDRIARALNQHKKSLNGSKIMVLGLAYKRDIDDLRESPSLTIIELLKNSGADVSYNDPFFPTVGRGRKYNLNMASTPLDTIADFDAVVIITDHTSYDYAMIVRESKLVIDTRNACKGIESPKIFQC